MNDKWQQALKQLDPHSVMESAEVLAFRMGWAACLADIRRYTKEDKTEPPKDSMAGWH